MKFDLNEVLSDMAGAVKNEVKDDWQVVKSTLITFCKAEKTGLNYLPVLD